MLAGEYQPPAQRLMMLFLSLFFFSSFFCILSLVVIFWVIGSGGETPEEGSLYLFSRDSGLYQSHLLQDLTTPILTVLIILLIFFFFNV